MHPFLQNDFHIKWSTLTPDHIEADISKALDEAKAAVDAVANQSAPLTYENTVAALDLGLETLNRAWGSSATSTQSLTAPNCARPTTRCCPK